MDGDELLAANRVADRRSADRGADVEAPKGLQLLVIEGSECAVKCAGEHEASRGCQNAGIIWIIELARRFNLSGCHVDRRDLASDAFSFVPDPTVPERAAHAGFVNFEGRAAVDTGAIGQLLRRVVCSREEIHPTLRVWADIEFTTRAATDNGVLLQFL